MILRSIIKLHFDKSLKRGDNNMSEFEVKVLSLLEKINDKLDKLLKSKPTSTVEIKAAGTGTVKPSTIVEKQEEEEKAIEKPPVEGRRICPDWINIRLGKSPNRSPGIPFAGNILGN